MTPAILDEPIRGAVQQRRKSRSHALHARTWFRIVGTLASGKKLTLRRRSNNSYSHVALYACPGVDITRAYFWRLTNGKVPKTFTWKTRKTATRFFPELVRYPTTESRLEAMQEHRITWWQQHRNHVAASWREARASLRSLPPGPAPGSSATGKPARYPVTLFTSLVCCTITEPENAVSGTPWPNCADSN